VRGKRRDAERRVDDTRREAEKRFSDVQSKAEDVAGRATERARSNV
jgi:vacuolar-type H+-ATPase subunit E/Vma4